MDSIECAATLSGLCVGAACLLSCACYGCVAPKGSQDNMAQGPGTARDAQAGSSCCSYGRSGRGNLLSFVVSAVALNALCACLHCEARPLPQFNARGDARGDATDDASGSPAALNPPSHLLGTTSGARQSHLAQASHQPSRSKNNQVSDAAPTSTTKDNVPKLQPLVQEVVDQFDLGTIQPYYSPSGKPRPGHFVFSKGLRSHVFTEQGLPYLLFSLASLDMDRAICNLTEEEEEICLDAFGIGERKINEILSGTPSRQIGETDPEHGGDRSQNQGRNLQANDNKNTQDNRSNNPFNWDTRNTGQTQTFWLAIQAPGLWWNFGKHFKVLEWITKSITQVGTAGWNLNHPKDRHPVFIAGRWTPAVFLSDKKKLPLAVRCLYAKMNNMENIKAMLGFKIEVHIDVARSYERLRMKTVSKSLQGYIRIEAVGKINIMAAWLRMAHAVGTKQKILPINPEGVWGFNESLDDQCTQLYERELKVAEQAAVTARLKMHEFEQALDAKVRHFHPDTSQERNDVLLEAAREAGVEINHKDDGSYNITFPSRVEAEIDFENPKKPKGKVLRITQRVFDILNDLGLKVGPDDGKTIVLPPEGLLQLDKLKFGDWVKVQIMKQLEGAVFSNANIALGPSVRGFYLDSGFLLLMVVTIPWGKPAANPTSKKGFAVVPLVVWGKSVQLLGNRSDVNPNVSAGIVGR
jgi:hypothetical protein